MGPELPLKDVVFTLLVKLGVASSLAALLARLTTFQRLLFKEQREFDRKILFVLLFGPLVALGVLIRILLGYRATDISLEGAMIAGLVGGRVTGVMVGALAALPAFFNYELLSLPFAAGCGAVGGMLRQLCRNKEQVWRFGPFVYLSIPRWLRDLLLRGQGDWQMLALLACVLLELARIGLGRAFPGKLYYVDTPQPIWLLLVVVTTVTAVAIPLMIWNNTRLQLKLKEQDRLLLQARMEALTSQINPHFLFNTLNTVASLIRVDRETARGLVVKLSNILRQLLRKHETFVPLREELQFIDDYLAIEVERFGPEKLQFFKQVEEDSLDAIVPSMLLQPIVENSIRHGLSEKIEGGYIRLSTARANGRLVIEVEDNGVGIPPDRIAAIYQSGIGMSNISERLKLLYGSDYLLRIDSRPGQGTHVRIELPELTPA
ncbi:MAG: sensor histidine kinase [Terriglobia bacterium]